MRAVGPDATPSSATPASRPTKAALKIARKFGHDKGIERPEIVVYEKAFHGRSIATLSATGNAKVQAGFGPLVEGFVRVPLNDVGGDREGRAHATRTSSPCSSR